MNCPSCSKKVAGSYEPGSYACSGCGAGIQVNPARPKHVQFGTEGANKRWGKSKATGTKKKTKKNPSFEYPPHASQESPGDGAGYARSQAGGPSYSPGQSATRNPAGNPPKGKASNIPVGTRVGLLPHLDDWMRGDKYGEVVKVGRTKIHVKLDRSGRTKTYSKTDLTLPFGAPYVPPPPHLRANPGATFHMEESANAARTQGYLDRVETQLVSDKGRKIVKDKARRAGRERDAQGRMAEMVATGEFPASAEDVANRGDESYGMGRRKELGYRTHLDAFGNRYDNPNLTLTEEDVDTIAFVGGRYGWSDALDTYDVGDNDIPEHEAWEIRDAIDSDMEGGHNAFPMLDTRSELAGKLTDFYQSIENPVGNPSGQLRRMYAVFAPDGLVHMTGDPQWISGLEDERRQAMRSEGFQPVSSDRSRTGWWIYGDMRKKEALSLGQRFLGLVTSKIRDTLNYDGPTFKMTSTVLQDFRLGVQYSYLPPGSDPVGKGEPKDPGREYQRQLDMEIRQFTDTHGKPKRKRSNPPFAEHELEAKEKHWALEDNPASTQYSIRLKQQGSGAWAGIRYYDTKVKAEMEFARLDAPRERTGTKGERYMMAIFHGNKKIKQNFYDNPTEKMNCAICKKSLMRGDYIYGACHSCAKKAITKASKK